MSECPECFIYCPECQQKFRVATPPQVISSAMRAKDAEIERLKKKLAQVSNFFADVPNETKSKYE